jgi:uncharacterized membrane protein YkgB
MFDLQHTKRLRGETQVVLVQRLVYGARRRWADVASSIIAISCGTNTLSLLMNGPESQEPSAATGIFAHVGIFIRRVSASELSHTRRPRATPMVNALDS